MGQLIAFEAAARTGSFTRAADELGISQPAVSHAMRALESELGVALFERRHKGVEMTDAGRHLLEQLTQGLTLIDQALRDLRSMTVSHPVTLAISTATATWWLLPRIARFKQLHPDIALRCITTDTDLDLERERIDLAITLGDGHFGHYQRWHFVDEEIFPVCSAAFLQRSGPLEDLPALTHTTLLHLEERYRPRLDWQGWLARFDVKLGRGNKVFRFNDYSIVLQAAIEGQGVALGWRHLVEPLITQGLLLRPFEHSVTTDQPIYIVASGKNSLRSEVVFLRDWLMRETAA
ncbi:MAG: LysR family transcriptional regulator [Rhodoferax sp.]|nr:LysR family transcriptional regulator [Rhodoferax sp.]